MAFSEESLMRAFLRGTEGPPGGNEAWQVGQTADGLASRLTWTLITKNKKTGVKQEVGSQLVAVCDREENVCWLDPVPLGTRRGRNKVRKLVNVAVNGGVVDMRFIPATEDELKEHARRLYERWKERYEARRQQMA